MSKLNKYNKYLSLPFAIIFIYSASITLGLAQPLDPSKKLTQYTLDSWGDEQGLISGGVMSMVQSDEGYIWIGTFNGIFRFDGVNFKHFNKNNTPAIINNGVTTITKDAVGNIWAGSHGGGVYIFNGDKIIKTLKTEDGLVSNVIRRLYINKAGHVFIGTGNGLSIYRDSTLSTYKSFHLDSLSSSNVSVSAFHEDRYGNMWIGTNQGLYQFRNEKLIRIPLLKNNQSAIEVLSVITNENNELLLATYGNGVLKQNGEYFEQFPLPLGMDKISSLYIDSNKSMWVCHQNGIYRYHNGRFDPLPSFSGTNEDAVEEVIEDKEGSIWITRYNGGIDRLRDGLFENYTIYEGLSDNMTHSIYEDRDGSKWIATVNGINHFKNGKFTVYTKESGHLIGNLVRDIYRDSNGTLWVATYDGLTTIKGNTIKHYTTKDGLSSNLVRVVFEDSKGTIWLGTRNGLNKFNNGGFIQYTNENGLSNNFVMSIAEPYEGELWIGTSGGGISVYKDDKFKRYSAKDGLPSNIVFRIYKDDENHIWIATNNGLCRYNGGFFSGFNTNNGFLNMAIFQVLEDEHHFFWITSDFGIIKVKRSELNEYIEDSTARIQEVSYKQVDGLKRSECTGAAKSMVASDGKIWFATLGGIAVVDVNETVKNTIPPPVLIETLVVDQVDYLKHSELIEIPPGSKSYEIAYTGLSLKVPDRVNFKYILEGYNEQWVNAGSRRTAYFTNLPPGEYSFKVIAANNDGVWSPEPAIISFVVHPRFYQTQGFYTFAVITVLAMLWGIYTFRVRSIKKEQVWLKQLVDERTNEIKQQKEEIEAQRDEIEERSKKLEEAQYIIKDQNDKLKDTNLLLEDTVNVRTEELKISNEKLIEKNRELDLFIYRSAHDLQGPIARILGLCQLGLQDNDPDQEKVYFDKLSHTANTMSKMLSRIIRIHDINVRELNISEVYVYNIVEEIFNERFRDLKIKDVKLKNSISSNVIIKTDKYLLKVALENLISNAYKFRAGADANTNFIQVELDNTNRISLLVSNYGIEIPETFRERIFDIFTVATDKQESTGLGLYETKIIASKLNGSIKLIRSDKGVTTFQLAI